MVDCENRYAAVPQNPGSIVANFGTPLALLPECPITPMGKETIMRHAVMAVAVAFGPHIAVVRRPARKVAEVVMTYLDHRRRIIDEK